MPKDQSDLTEFVDKMQLLWIESLAGGKELVSVWSGHKPQPDDCEEKMQGEILEQEFQQLGDKKKTAARRKETQAAPWRPMWHRFPECALIAGS